MDKLLIALQDIADHAKPPFMGGKWANYIREVAEGAIQSFGEESHEHLARQLTDIMRENERLRAEIAAAKSFFRDAIAAIDKAEDPNKHSGGRSNAKVPA